MFLVRPAREAIVDPNHHLAHESALTQAVRQCQFLVVGALPSGLVVFPLALDPMVQGHCCSSLLVTTVDSHWCSVFVGQRQPYSCMNNLQVGNNRLVVDSSASLHMKPDDVSTPLRLLSRTP